MAIKAKKLNASKLPGRTELYEVGSSCELPVEEKQKDGSLDRVILIYCVEKGNIGYFAKEYRPIDVEKTGAKVIDITAVMLDCGEKCVRWHLYDIKDTLAGENTIVKLYDQWSFGLRYLQKNILDGVTGYRVIPDLGVITRCYDERRMERLRDDYQKRCGEIENYQQNMPLPLRKKRVSIAKYRGILRAAQSLLDRRFQTEDGTDTYEIHIRQLKDEKGQVYQLRFLV